MITKLYTVYRAQLLRYCGRLCGNADEAEDLLQETFLRALSHLDVLEDLSEPQQRAWLYKVARNLFYDRCRRQALWQNTLLQPEEETDGGFTELETELLLSLLPPDLSEIFRKRYFEGYSSQELAETYGLSPSGIRGALSRARKILREKLNNDGG